MSTAKFDTLSNLAGSQTVPVSTVAQGSAKAWVNFNGTGTVTIRASFNVSSITDNGTGNYTVNFTTAMPDANYSATLGAGLTSSGGSDFNYGVLDATTPRTTTAVRLCYLTNNGGTFADTANYDVAIFR
jgi:hypothetical protein